MSGVITRLETQKRNKQRVNVYIDDAYVFSLTMEEAAKLHRGQTLTDAEIAALNSVDEVQRAVDAGAHFLASRPRSVREVRRRLYEKEVAEPVIDAAIDRLTTLGYLDDLAFANFWVKERMTFKPTSPRALRYELKQKGVPDDIIAEALAELDAEEAAYRAAETAAKRLRGYTRRDFHDKLLAVLARRGFGYSVARSVIQRLSEAIEADDPQFFADETRGKFIDEVEPLESDSDAPFDTEQ